MNMKKIFTSIALSMAVLLGNSQLANAERIKDIANLQGVRNNQLVGYGLVVGLDGSGDQTTQTPFTAQSIGNMLALQLIWESYAWSVWQFIQVPRRDGYGKFTGVRSTRSGFRCKCRINR